MIRMLRLEIELRLTITCCYRLWESVFFDREAKLQLERRPTKFFN